MKSLPLLGSLDAWTPEQLLAVHDFCQLIGETIWQYHGEELIDHIRRQDRASRINGPTTTEQENLPLPFEDDLSF